MKFYRLEIVRNDIINPQTGKLKPPVMGVYETTNIKEFIEWYKRFSKEKGVIKIRPVMAEILESSITELNKEDIDNLIKSSKLF